MKGICTHGLLLIIFCCGSFCAGAQPLVDKVIVYKSRRIMKLMSGDKVVKQYRVSLGQNSKGHKQQYGDSRTPEGRYLIDYRNPKSLFYLSLHISYPNDRDRAKARERGVSPGGDIFIHGRPNGKSHLSILYRHIDWTDGCIAVSDREMDEIWRLVKIRTEIVILP